MTGRAFDDLLLDRVVVGGAGHRSRRRSWALRAAELRLALPFARPVRDELVHALAHLRSRLN